MVLKKYSLLFKAIIILISAFFVCNSCDNNNYRDPYLGKWYFTVKILEFDLDSIYSDSTINYAGNITYGRTDSDLEVQYTEDNIVNLSVDDGGKLSNFPSDDSYGFIAIDTIYFKIHWGGLGGGVTHIIAGNR